jgi:hypothetical protein
MLKDKSHPQGRIRPRDASILATLNLEEPIPR